MLGQLDEAHALLDAALLIDPGYSRGDIYRSWLFRSHGRPKDSLSAAKRGASTDPHSLLNRHSYSWAMFCSGLAKEALMLERKLQMAYPQDDVAQGYVGIFAAYLGNYNEALAASEASTQLSPGRPAVCAAAAYVLARAGQTKRARQLAENALEAVLPRAPRPMLAPGYLELGDRERALDLMREACDEGCAWSAPARLDPRLSDLKSDDKFLALFS